MAAVEMQAPDFCCPCGGFLGWKHIRLGGRRLSKSYSDLRLLGRSASRGWAWDGSPDRPILQEVDEEKTQPKQPRASIETLPVEVLSKYPSSSVVYACVQRWSQS
jgi:hypothetical protein